MGFTVTVSGVYRNPQTQPLPGVTLIFETIYNSNQTQLQTTVSTITEVDGSYSISLVPNTYAAYEFSAGRKKWLGNIQVFSDSIPGTLNDYLTNFQPDQSSIGSAGEAAASAAAAANSAAAAKVSEDASADSASAAAASAAAAKTSETASAASATAAKSSEDASAVNASAAADSAATAKVSEDASADSASSAAA
ncbi:hypothetical protein QF33_23595, partial [Salmonella enterica subsp. enterica serovar Enteritidis]|nr:hypothetical protein [Salmonella enterica subsp. enterica serovar Enteritidis]